MLWRIVTSLGNVAAVQVDSVPEKGVCIEFRNFQQADASILIYQDGKLEDVTINGCVFPCVYNKLGDGRYGGDDIYGGVYKHEIEFSFIDSNGLSQEVFHKLYGMIESAAVEYFYSLIYNISCCTCLEQYKGLYKNIIDVTKRYWHLDRAKALEILNFIEEFTLQLPKVEDVTYLQSLKLKLNTIFREAQEVISKAECPE